MQNLKLNQANHILYTLTGSSLFLLSGFLVLSFLAPFTVDNSYADSESTSYGTTVNIAPNLSISATDVSISDTPEASGSWLTGTSNVVVSTNNATGYKLYVSSSDTQVDLVNSDSSSAKISNLPAETTESTFKSDSSLMNHYGFTHDNNGTDPESGQITTGTYLPITDINNSRLIKATAEKQNISTTNVTFATKVDRSIPAGEYTNTITFTAIANPVVTPIQDGMNMQDVTQQMCADTPLYSESGTTYTLTDTRDNSTYQIRKLADGNCWMTQNLRLVGPKTLTPNDSNVSTNFSLTASNNNSWCNSSTSDCIDETKIYYSNSYGTYYNWIAATAGSGSYSTTNNASYSVCPKNWHIPTGNVDGEWYQMMITTYGYNNDNTNLPNLTDWTQAAINLPFSGYRNHPGNNSNGVFLDFTGTTGYFWSSTANGYSFTYTVYIKNDGTLRAAANSTGGKQSGFPVRCVLSSE